MSTEIRVKNLKLRGYHGVRNEEKSLGQIFEIDVRCVLDSKPPFSDSMKNTVCYGEVCDLICEVSASEAFNLIETLGERIMSALFESFELITQIDVEIRKPNAPIRHIVDHVGVVMTRSRHG